MVAAKAFPPRTVWACVEALPGATMGSRRSVTRVPGQGILQYAFTGLVNVATNPKAMRSKECTRMFAGVEENTGELEGQVVKSR